jgi:hypothetical protein
MLSRRVVGIWDVRVERLSIGGALVFAAELVALGEKADVCVLGMPASPSSTKHPALSVLQAMNGIGEVHQVNTLADVFSIAGKDSLWPLPDTDGTIRHDYSSTLLLQRWFTEKGIVPRLSCKKAVTGKAIDFLERNVHAHYPVAVHLKNQAGQPGCSNANMAAWKAFFEGCVEDSAVTFVLVGDDPVPAEISSLANVVRSRDLGSDLLLDMAIIQHAAAFMGMATGPCQMAVFNCRPYVIFKNPDHHAEEMWRELGSRDAFAFSGTSQKLLRVLETPVILHRELAAMRSAR